MRFFIRKVIKYILVIIGVMLKIFTKRENKIIILMYHRINDSVKKELSVKINSFKWHMNYLKKNKYKVISMDEAYEKISSDNIDDNYVVITFDDGYEDFYYNGYPLLKKYGFHSTLYIVPNYINENKLYWWDKDLNESELLSWNQIRRVVDSGIVDIGSHTCNHLDLKGLNNKQLLYEIVNSKIVINKKLDIEVKHFSYPRGIYSFEAEKMIRKHYDTGVLIYNGNKLSHKLNKNSLSKLRRIPIQRSDGKYLFVARLKGLLILEEMCKKIFRRYI